MMELRVSFSWPFTQSNATWHISNQALSSQVHPPDTVDSYGASIVDSDDISRELYPFVAGIAGSPREALRMHYPPPMDGIQPISNFHTVAAFGEQSMKRFVGDRKWSAWMMQLETDFPSKRRRSMWQKNQRRGLEYTQRIETMRDAPSSIKWNQVIVSLPHFILPDDVLVIVEHDEDVKWGPACGPSYSEPNQCMIGTSLSDFRLEDTLFTLPALKVKNPPPSWSVDVHLHRPDGIANTGTLSTVLRNPHDCHALVHVQQHIIPIISPKWRTLRTVLQDTSGELNHTLHSGLSDHNVDFLDFTAISWSHDLPPRSTLTWEVDYDPMFLPFSKMPGDANRGIELPPARATFACQSQPTTTLTSPTVLILSPLQDLSMPFNVLSLTCTLYAFAIGGIHSWLTLRGRDAVQYTMDPDEEPPGRLGRVKQLFLFLLSMVVSVAVNLLDLVKSLRNRSGGPSESEKQPKEDKIDDTKED